MTVVDAAVVVPRVRTSQRSVRVGPVSVRVHRRSVVVGAAALVVALAGMCLSVSVGDFPIPLTDVVPAIFGYGDPDSDFIVRTLRLPRALTGVFVGAAFGLSGAIFQSVARNPLASPDIIGINAGAAAAAVFVIVVAGSGSTVVSLGALAGSALTATVVYLLARKGRTAPGYRLVLVGIGVGAVLGSVTSYLLTRAEITDAQRATVWLTGSLHGRGLTVADLVARGRHPHQKWFRQWTSDDEAAVTEALTATDCLEFAERPVDELSGGQRQRAWIAMALAQDTEIVLLDEPTTFLDLAHQIEVLDLLDDLNRIRGRTIVLVLHDVNQACRYATHLVAMKCGRAVAEGPPAAVVTEELMADVFNLTCRIVTDPVSATPLVIPIGARHRTGACAAAPDAT